MPFAQWATTFADEATLTGAERRHVLGALDERPRTQGFGG
jgi:hypothetical protein